VLTQYVYLEERTIARYALIVIDFAEPKAGV